jgi:peptidoglycan/LPS O-acetylase OafA/YrhL
MRAKYLPALDGLRGVAITLVFVSHVHLESVLPKGFRGALPGSFGVTVFFFLSGYLITSLLRAEWSDTGDISIRKFYLRRVRRILPPLYVVLTLAWILDALGIPARQTTGLGISAILFYFFNYMVVLHPHLENIVPAGLGVTWSLMVEEHFYFLFPFAYLLLQKRGVSAQRVVAILGGVCVLVLLWRLVLVYGLSNYSAEFSHWTYRATDTRFDSILFGCIMAVAANPWCSDKNEFLERNKLGLAVAGFAVIAISLLIRNGHYRETLRYTVEGVCLFPIFYYIVSTPTSKVARFLQLPPMRWLGWTSYTIYLVSIISIDIVTKYTRLPPIAAGVVAAVGAGLFGELMRRLVENPLRRLGKAGQPQVAGNKKIHGNANFIEAPQVMKRADDQA